MPALAGARIFTSHCRSSACSRRSLYRYFPLMSTPFPIFSLLTITLFISHLNANKKPPSQLHQRLPMWNPIFHKLIFGSPSPEIASSKTSMLIKVIQRAQPTRPANNSRHFSQCISTHRRGYHSIHTARTLDAMFILAFFGFLRFSEFTSRPTLIQISTQHF